MLNIYMSLKSSQTCSQNFWKLRKFGNKCITYWHLLNARLFSSLPGEEVSREITVGRWEFFPIKVLLYTCNSYLSSHCEPVEENWLPTIGLTLQVLITCFSWCTVCNVRPMASCTDSAKAAHCLWESHSFAKHPFHSSSSGIVTHKIRVFKGPWHPPSSATVQGTEGISNPPRPSRNSADITWVAAMGTHSVFL